MRGWRLATPLASPALACGEIDSASEPSSAMGPDASIDLDAGAKDAATIDVGTTPSNPGAPCGVPGAVLCTAGFTCRFPDGACGSAGGAIGICTAVPDECGADLTPVCGCDDLTYGNACSAQVQGISVLRAGECTYPEAPAGLASPCTLGGPPCPSGLACVVHDVFPTCAPTAAGSCLPPPTHCPTNADPACGCDGVTYGNGCQAHAHSQTVAHQGACS